MRTPKASVNVRLIALLFAASLAAGCDTVRSWLPQPQESRYVLVLVDSSTSVAAEDNALYTQSFNSLLDALKPGDRLELGEISDHSLTRYAPVCDEIMPNTGVELRDKRECNAARAKMKDAFAKRQNLATKSEILDALALAQQRFAANSGSTRKAQWLIILSDMIQEGTELNFAKKGFSEKDATTFVEARKAQGRMPNLSGVEVFVGGASAPTAAVFEMAQRFWITYLTAAGANIPAKNYQRAPLHFEKFGE